MRVVNQRPSCGESVSGSVSGHAPLVRSGPTRGTTVHSGATRRRTSGSRLA